MANPDLPPGALAKPLPDSGRLQRKKNRNARKQGIEPESHAEMLARVEFWRVLRLEVYAYYSGRCAACQKALNIEQTYKGADDYPHTCHIVHKSRGGLDVLENLMLGCGVCHKLHHDGLLTIYRDTDRSLAFTLRDKKQRLVKTWSHVTAQRTGGV